MNSLKSKDCPVHTYAGKFTNNSPTICPAGILFTKPDETIKKAFEWYTIEEKMDALKHDVGIYNEKPEMPPKALKCNISTRGLLTRVSTTLQPGDQNAYEHLQNELKETSYDSYWTQPLGRSRDKVTDLPIGMDILNTTFGVTTSVDDITDIMMTGKTEDDLKKESMIGHENYIKSHNSYFHEEQINRKYNCAFSKYHMFGKPTHADPQGKYMKNCLKWFNNKNLTMANSKQVEWARKNVSRLGKVLEPNQNTKNVPPDHVFGMPSRGDVYGVTDLLNECSTASVAKELKFWLKHINKVRSLLQKRYPKFRFIDFYDSMRYYDKDKTEWLHKDIVYAVCNQFNVSFDRCKIENLLNYLKILKDDFYNIKAFADILNQSEEFPNLPITTALPPEFRYYESTAQASYKTDYTCDDELNLPPAGLRLLRSDLPPPDIDLLGNGCKAHYEHLGGESTVRSSINPSIQTTYNVTHRDYLKFRPKDQIKGIFKRVTEMSDEHFEFLWTEAEKLENGQVNVQMIRDLLKKYAKI